MNVLFHFTAVSFILAVLLAPILKLRGSAILPDASRRAIASEYVCIPPAALIPMSGLYLRDNPP